MSSVSGVQHCVPLSHGLICPQLRDSQMETAGHAPPRGIMLIIMKSIERNDMSSITIIRINDRICPTSWERMTFIW